MGFMPISPLKWMFPSEHKTHDLFWIGIEICRVFSTLLRVKWKIRRTTIGLKFCFWFLFVDDCLCSVSFPFACLLFVCLVLIHTCTINLHLHNFMYLFMHKRRESNGTTKRYGMKRKGNKSCVQMRAHTHTLDK